VTNKIKDLQNKKGVIHYLKIKTRLMAYWLFTAHLCEEDIFLKKHIKVVMDDYVKITNSIKIRNCQKKKLCVSHSNFKGTFCVTNLRVNIIVFFLSLVQCHCGLNWLGVHHLTFSEGECPPPHTSQNFLPTQAKIRFFFSSCWRL
jgi:hypothetical protein